MKDMKEMKGKKLKNSDLCLKPELFLFLLHALHGENFLYCFLLDYPIESGNDELETLI